jgi:hypothetical protein
MPHPGRAGGAPTAASTVGTSTAPAAPFAGAIVIRARAILPPIRTVVVAT